MVRITSSSYSRRLHSAFQDHIGEIPPSSAYFLFISSACMALSIMLSSGPSATDFFSFPSPRRICVAAESAFASVLLLRNGLVPLCLVAIAVAISIVHGERILARKWLLACFAALLAGIAILGFNESAHYAWIVDNVMPRFVWLCALPLLVSDGHRFSGGTSPYLAYSRPH